MARSEFLVFFLYLGLRWGILMQLIIRGKTPRFYTNYPFTFLWKLPHLLNLYMLRCHSPTISISDVIVLYDIKTACFFNEAIGLKELLLFFYYWLIRGMQSWFEKKNICIHFCMCVQRCRWHCCSEGIACSQFVASVKSIKNTLTCSNIPLCWSIFPPPARGSPLTQLVPLSLMIPCCSISQHRSRATRVKTWEKPSVVFAFLLPILHSVRSISCTARCLEGF